MPVRRQRYRDISTQDALVKLMQFAGRENARRIVLQRSSKTTWALTCESVSLKTELEETEEEREEE